MTALTACSSTWSGVMRNFSRMCIGEVAINVWMRPERAGLMAAPARSMSFSMARARAHTVLSVTAAATAFTDSKSPGLATGNPASMISTRMRSSSLAIRTFSSRVMDAPGLCSPSRKVVSNIIKWSLILFSLCTVHSGRAGHIGLMGCPRWAALIVTLRIVFLARKGVIMRLRAAVAGTARANRAQPRTSTE